ncbi:MAG: DUF1800 family protein [Burkholderiales bacterium]|nr:DUF1800 family protein [Burkholderiales bacterium]
MNLVHATRRAAGAIAAAALLGWAPCAFAVAPDSDGDGIPDAIEIAEGRNPAVKDNDIFADASLFVRQQYRDMLRREGDAGGVEYWAGQVRAGAVARETLIYNMLHAPETLGRLAPVMRLYLAYFRRAPDRDGLDYWADQRSAGRTLAEISQQFAGSQEFAVTYGSTTDREFVQLVYRNVLERQPDAAGFTHWLGELASGRQTRGTLMAVFSESAEFAAKTSAQVRVALLYIAMMGRSPDPDGFAYWSSRLSTGASDLSLVQAFYNSVEYRDRFVHTFSMAATAPAVDAARFLAQASFGPRSLRDIADLQSKGYSRWLDEQMAAPATSHMAYMNAALVRHNTGYVYDEDVYESIWQHWIRGEDQLRARVAFALSQFFVISNIAPNLDAWAMASYMDLLNRNAFGNYRTLLEEVTLHPAMGFYLDMLKSRKEDPATGRHPNENYAREVLQLFSIGLVRLNLDGTPVPGTDGKPVPTYDEDVVQGFAKAFSGWSFGGADTSDPKAFLRAKANWTVPMQAWASEHSEGTKLLLEGVTLPAFQTPQTDMRQALDNIFYHPNVGPFFCRVMLQRLVTSNPSRGQVQRCATAFNDNGFGERGNLRAVFRAILLDPEARDLGLATGPGAGKQREPVVRFANFLRALGASSTSGRNAIHYLDSADDSLGQSPLLAPSVFNFFSPFFRPMGPVAAAGLVAPEFQITTETSVVGALNFFTTLADKGYYGWSENQMKLDYGTLQALAGSPPMLVAHIDMLLMAGQMSPALRDTMVRAVAAMPASNARNRVEAALMIAAASPDFVIQK